MTEVVQEVPKKTGAVSMRLRPQEQTMFAELADTYNLYGATNAVRAAGRILFVLNLSSQRLMELLERYEKEHPEAEPCRFIVEEEENESAE